MGLSNIVEYRDSWEGEHIAEHSAWYKVGADWIKEEGPLTRWSVQTLK